MKQAWPFLLFACLLLSYSEVLLGQTAELTGRVSDPSEAAVPGVTVNLTNVATGIKRTAPTNTEGIYVFPLLQPGPYEITIEAPGFKTVHETGITLQVAQIARHDFRLEIGAVTESVSVRATGPLLETERATLAQVIENQKIIDLPLNGRVFTQLSTLIPGALTQTNSFYFNAPNLAINGARTSAMNYMVEGVNASENFFNGAALIPNIDAIQEFRVQSNSFSAEYGQGNAVVNLQLKSGTNKLRGTVFEFLRNEALDARNFFAVGHKPMLRQNQFGFLLGGPVMIPGLLNGRDRHFFFVDYQGARIARGKTFNNLAATDRMWNGNFSGLPAISDPATTRADPNRPGSFIRDLFPNNQIPAGRFSPQSTFFHSLIPGPNTATGTFSYSPPQREPANQFDVKMDHKLREADSITGSYHYQGGSRLTPGPAPKHGEVDFYLRTQAARLSEVHTFSPRTFNELRLGYLRTRTRTVQQGLGTNLTVQSGIQGFAETSLESPGYPGLNITSYLGVLPVAFHPVLHISQKYDLVDNIMMVRGKHIFKTGIDFRWFWHTQFNGGYSRGSFNFTGTYSGNAFADYLLGLPFVGSRSFPRNTWGTRNENYRHFYFQDDWKVTPRVTLNLGLRYEVEFAPHLMRNTIASFDPRTGKLIVGTDSKGNFDLTAQQVTQYLYPLYKDMIVTEKSVGLPPTFRHMDLNDFAPRVGLGWQVLNNTVLRMGYGIFYTLSQTMRTGSVAIGSPPFIADEFGNFNSTPIPTRTLANLFQDFSQGNVTITPPIVFQLDPNQRTQYLQQWNIALQHVFHNLVSVEGAYVGSKGTRLDFSHPFNIPPPGPGAIQGRRPFPRFGPGYIIDANAYSTYNALQTKTEIRGWRGLSFLASYAFAKSIDIGSADPQQTSTAFRNPNNLNLEKGSSDFDVKHRFVLSLNYSLPFGKAGNAWAAHLVRGWSIGGILTLQSGLPFSPAIGTDPANQGLLDRPDRVADGRMDQRTLNQDFNVSAFKVPAQFTSGTSGRNIVYGRGFKNLDLALLRDFPVTERVRIQFRAEAFNASNTPAFGLPTSNIQSTLAGRILTAGEPRDVQFALKVSF